MSSWSDPPSVPVRVSPPAAVPEAPFGAAGRYGGCSAAQHSYFVPPLNCPEVSVGSPDMRITERLAEFRHAVRAAATAAEPDVQARLVAEAGLDPAARAAITREAERL